MNNSQEVRNIILKLLKKNDTNTNKMLTELGYSNTLLLDMKRKGSMPSVDKLAKIAEYLNCSIEYLLYHNDTSEIQNKSDKTNTIEDSSDTPASVENFLNKLKNGSPRGAVVVFKDGKGKEIIDMENMTEEQFKKIDAILDNYRNKE